MKRKYYVVWVEGIDYKDGEKIKSFNEDTGDVEYTTKMSEAMRVKIEHLATMKMKMENAGISSWVINGNSFVKVSYAPSGTIFRP